MKRAATRRPGRAVDSQVTAVEPETVQLPMLDDVTVLDVDLAGVAVDDVEEGCRASGPLRASTERNPAASRLPTDMVMFAVEHIQDVVDDLYGHGIDLRGKPEQDDSNHPVCYVGDPDCTIVALP